MKGWCKYTLYLNKSHMIQPQKHLKPFKHLDLLFQRSDRLIQLPKINTEDSQTQKCAEAKVPFLSLFNHGYI